MPRRFTLFVVAAMIGGVVMGFELNRAITDPAQLRQVADDLGVGTDMADQDDHRAP